MPLLEKAYAKFNLNYLQLNGGIEAEALRALTGKPTVVYETKDLSADALFNLILDAERKNYIMTGGCDISRYGLVANHAYSVISALVLIDD